MPALEHDVWIPALLRELTGGAETVRVPGETVGEVVAHLDTLYPGIQARLCQEEALRSYISLAVNGEISRRGLRHKLTGPSEIHFVPALSGG